MLNIYGSSEVAADVTCHLVCEVDQTAGSVAIGKPISNTQVYLVDEYFNDSTGVGDEGETDARGPWNTGGNWKIVEQPELEQGVENFTGAANARGKNGKSVTSKLKRTA